MVGRKPGEESKKGKEKKMIFAVLAIYILYIQRVGGQCYIYKERERGPFKFIHYFSPPSPFYSFVLFGKRVKKVGSLIQDEHCHTNPTYVI